MSRQLISVVLPVYNQGDHIGRVIPQYQEALGLFKAPYELILVVNASRDDSLRICRSMARQDRRIRVLHSALPGWGRAVRLGLKASRGSTLCFTNSSRTDPADLGELLLRSSLSPGRVVKAERRQRESPLRRLGSMLYNLECRLLLGSPSRDINGTPKVFPASFAKLLELESEGDMLDAEFVAVCVREAYPLIEAPVFNSRRHGGRSTTRWASALGMYAGAWKLWRRMGGRAR